MKYIIITICAILGIFGFSLGAGAAASSTPKTIVLKVPFTSQAPTFAWSNPRFQDACEEASVLMAMKWAKGESIYKDATSTKKIAQEILNISNYQSKNSITYHDTSASTTAKWLIKGYYNHGKFEVRKNITLSGLIKELEKGNIIIVPTNGQLLNNPNFTGIGPLNHMLVIKGYDYNNKIFITNDPGTRKGESYKYPAATLYKAISDYADGRHLPRKTVEKTVIIVRK